MSNKAALTKAFIIKSVAPVFNRKGYSGTSLNDVSMATGLTKGAIYGNFKDKHELAVEAFKYNINKITGQIEIAIEQQNTAISKLYAIVDFFEGYYQYTFESGGCPILNIGIDSNHQNEVLLEKVKKAIQNIQSHISKIIAFGITQGELKKSIDPNFYARQIFSSVEGAIFMSMTIKSDIYMKDMSKGLRTMIQQELIQ